MKRAVFCGCLVLCIASLSAGVSRTSVKDRVETATDRLAVQVTIRRDTYGVPHILAKNEEAAAFGLGYAQAEDHCITIVRRFVAARGEAAKYLGQGAESDFLMKRFDNLDVCRKNFGQLDPLLQRIFNAYAAGVNHYVSKHRQELPGLSKTRNLREWLGVMKLGLLNYSNFTYADAQGNILYQWNAHIPLRVDDGTSYQLDVPGETARFFWRGLHPMTDFPRLLNPSGGYIQNCNNPPWYTSLRDPIDPAGFRSYFERGELGLRPQLALEMLESQPKFSLDDVKRMKFNTRMLIADRLKPDLIKAIKAVSNPLDDLLKGLAVIEAWDNTASADAKGAVLFQRFASTYLEATKKPYAVDWNRQEPARTPSGISDPVLAVKHFEDAVKWTRDTFGSEAVAWGQVHRFRFKDVDLPGDGAPGAQGAFRVMGFRPMPDGKRVAGWVSDNEPLQGFGDGWVIAVEFSRPVKAYSVLAYGQTTNSASKHSRDQIGLFANHEYKRVWFSEAEIKANLESEYRP